MIRQSTWTGRTGCTSSIQREVIQAQGHSGSNQNCTSSTDCDCSVITAPTLPCTRLFRRTHGPRAQFTPPSCAILNSVRTYGLRFDVNCSILFTELPLLERPAAVKAAGFDGVESWWPWDERPVPTDKEADASVAPIKDAGVELVSLNFLTGDMAAGERGLLSVPKAKDAFRRNVEACTELAARLGCTRLNAPYGNRLDPEDASLTAQQAEGAIENLMIATRHAAKTTPGATIRLDQIT